VGGREREIEQMDMDEGLGVAGDERENGRVGGMPGREADGEVSQ